MNRILPAEDRQSIRLQFPQLEETAYFNTASIGPWPEVTRKAIMEQIEEWNHLTDSTAKVFDYWRATKKESAKMINAAEDDIAFAFNTSFGLSQAAAGIDFKPGDEIILSDVEFPANTYPWTNLERKGVVVKFIPTTNRFFDIDIFKKAITKNTRLFSISFVQFFNGFRNDIETLGEICEEHGIFFVVDGIQGVGNVPIDVKKAKIDLLACGCQKWLLSPQSCGFFYLSKKPKIEVHPGFAGWFGVDWHQNWSDLIKHHLEPQKTVERFSLSGLPHHQIFGMHSSIKLINSIRVDRINSHNLGLIDRLIGYFENQKYYKLVSNIDPINRSSILSFTCEDLVGIYKYLTDKRIVTSMREGGIRIAVNFYNTPGQIDNLIHRLDEFQSGKKP
jgi:cysteine desulfurase/selenocysteine lyase